MAFERLTYSKSWHSREDFPAYEPDETTVRSDLQLLHDEAKDAINRLVDKLNDPGAAAQLPFAPVGTLQAQTVQAAIEQVYQAVADAAAALIVDGSVTKEKLCSELLERVYGGRLWVSMDAPGAAQCPDTDLPVGQLWMRPDVTVRNLALEQWQVSGGSAVGGEEGWSFTTDGTQDYLTASQLLENVGGAGKQVPVRIVFGPGSGTAQEVSLFLNGVEVDGENGIYEAVTDQTGCLEIQIYAQWAEALQGQTIELEAFAVIDPEEILPEGCRPCSDWSGILEQLDGKSVLQLPRKLWLQTGEGVWEEVMHRHLSVENGGTGLGVLERGALLRGSDTQTMEQVAPSENGILQCLDGVPQWVQPQALAKSCGYLSTQTGSYEGDGGAAERVLELPVTPQFLLLWAADGSDATQVIANGGKASKTFSLYAGGMTSSYAASVHLKGSTLTFCHENTGNYADQAKAQHMNREGVSYSWLAVY